MRAWLLERSPRYGRFIVALAVAATPAIMLPASLDTFNLAKLTFVWVCAVAALWLWFAWSAEAGARLPRFNLGVAAGAFLAAYLLATIFSRDRVTSFLGMYHRYGGFLPVAIYAVIAFVVVALHWEQPARLKTVASAVAAGTLPVSLYTLIQEAGFDWIPWSTRAGDPPKYPGSTLGNSNFLGGYLAISLPFLVYLLICVKHTLLRVAISMGLVAAVASLWFSGSRGGLMAAGGGLSAMAFVHRDRLARWARTAIFMLLLLGVAVAVVVVWHPGMDSAPGPLRDIDVLRTDTFRLRSHYWAAAGRIFLDNPLLGTGPDTFAENYKTYHLSLSATDLAAGVPDKPHNIYLEYAAGSGLLGLGTYLILIVLALRYALKRAAVEEGSQKALLSAFLGGLSAYLIQGFFSMDVPPIALMGWVSVAGIAVLSDPRLLAARDFRTVAGRRKGARKPKREDASPRRRSGGKDRPGRRRLKQGAGAVAALGLVAFGARPLLADVMVKGAMLGSTPPPQALGQLRRGHQLHPWGSTYLTMATTRVFRQARLSPEGAREDVFRQAHLWLERAATQDPESMFAAMNLARINELWARNYDASRYKAADRWWTRAVSLDPSSWRLGLRYGRFLGHWALETDDAEAKRKTVSVLEELAERTPAEPEVWLALGKAYILQAEIPRARIAFEQAMKIRPEYNEPRVWLRRLSSGRRSPGSS